MRVTGYIDQILYTVETSASATGDMGVVTSASPEVVVRTLREGVDTECAITPVGPFIKGSLDTEKGVLAILLANTTVIGTLGAPDLDEENASGAILATP